MPLNLAERKHLVRTLLPSQFWPADHETTLETEINSIIKMEKITSAVEKMLVAGKHREFGHPSKHQLGIGMVYRHVANSLAFNFLECLEFDVR